LVVLRSNGVAPETTKPIPAPKQIGNGQLSLNGVNFVCLEHELHLLFNSNFFKAKNEPNILETLKRIFLNKNQCQPKAL